MKKIYIIQFRTDASEAHEQHCYHKRLPHLVDRLVYVNAITSDLPTTVPDDMGCAILGGSGQFSCTTLDTDPWKNKTHAFIDLILESNIPLLGVCYGAQLLGPHQGARLVSDKKLSEVGVFEVTLLDQAKNDPIFSQLPQTFDAQFGHKDTVVDFPDHLIPLVRSQRVPVQAFRVQGKQAWGLTFHPELDYEDLRHRVIDLFPEYVPEGQTAEGILKNFRDTPEAEQVLHHFVDLALNNKK
jgi:GMP synthase (glutamine-hydrolysing)